MIYDERGLNEELVQAGLGSALRYAYADGRIDWYGTPTQAHLDLAQAVLSVHDPAAAAASGRERMKSAADQAQRLTAHSATPKSWSAITAAERLEDNRVAAQLTALLFRLLPR